VYPNYLIRSGDDEDDGDSIVPSTDASVSANGRAPPVKKLLALGYCTDIAPSRVFAVEPETIPLDDADIDDAGGIETTDEVAAPTQSPSTHAIDKVDKVVKIKQPQQLAVLTIADFEGTTQTKLDDYIKPGMDPQMLGKDGPMISAMDLLMQPRMGVPAVPLRQRLQQRSQQVVPSIPRSWSTTSSSSKSSPVPPPISSPPASSRSGPPDKKAKSDDA
jgi:hypothetical protein